MEKFCLKFSRKVRFGEIPLNIIFQTHIKMLYGMLYISLCCMLSNKSGTNRSSGVWATADRRTDIRTARTARGAAMSQAITGRSVGARSRQAVRRNMAPVLVRLLLANVTWKWSTASYRLEFWVAAAETNEWQRAKLTTTITWRYKHQKHLRTARVIKQTNELWMTNAYSVDRQLVLG